jgi:hypothetical protein
MAGPLGEMFDHGCDAMNTTVRTTYAHRLVRGEANNLNVSLAARGPHLCSRSQPRPKLVDGRIPDGCSLQLLPVSQAFLRSQGQDLSLQPAQSS